MVSSSSRVQPCLARMPSAFFAQRRVGDTEEEEPGSEPHEPMDTPVASIGADMKPLPPAVA
eukprot:5403288-Pleurochrysis_carterae.AAC.1